MGFVSRSYGAFPHIHKVEWGLDLRVTTEMQARDGSQNSVVLDVLELTVKVSVRDVHDLSHPGRHLNRREDSR